MLLLFLHIYNSTSAQTGFSDIQRGDGAYPARVIIKASPLSLIDSYPSIQGAIEYKVRPRLMFQNELGIIYPYLRNNEDYYNMQGVRARFEVRHYLKDYFNEVYGLYIAPEIFFIHANYLRFRTVGRECTDGFCNYFERTEYKVYKNVFGYHLKIGYQFFLSPRFLMDYYGGVGLRHVFIHNSENIDVDSFNGSPFFSTHSVGKFLRPSASLGMKIGYLIKKDK